MLFHCGFLFRPVPPQFLWVLLQRSIDFDPVTIRQYVVVFNLLAEYTNRHMDRVKLCIAQRQTGIHGQLHCSSC